MHTYYKCALEKKAEKILVDIGLCFAIAPVMEVDIQALSSCNVGVAMKCSKSGPVEIRPAGTACYDRQCTPRWGK